MSKKPTVIWFITWPDGKLFEGTQTSIDERFAIARAIQTWLPQDWFPGLNLAVGYSPTARELWPLMQKAGFKVHELEVPTDTADGISA